jgi:hypothetical protein
MIATRTHNTRRLIPVSHHRLTIVTYDSHHAFSSLGCKKSARDSTGKCIKHGGGRRCTNPGCNKSAQVSCVIRSRNEPSNENGKPRPRLTICLCLLRTQRLLLNGSYSTALTQRLLLLHTLGGDVALRGPWRRPPLYQRRLSQRRHPSFWNVLLPWRRPVIACISPRLLCDSY